MTYTRHGHKRATDARGGPAMSRNRRMSEPNLGYLARDEFPYRQIEPTWPPCTHWFLGQSLTEKHYYSESAHLLNRRNVGRAFDHAGFFNVDGRRVMLTQPYGSPSESLQSAREWAWAHGLEVHRVAQRVSTVNERFSTVGLLFAAEGIDVSDIVAKFRERWLALVPGASAPRPSGDARSAHPAGSARRRREVAGDPKERRP